MTDSTSGSIPRLMECATDHTHSSMNFSEAWNLPMFARNFIIAWVLTLVAIAGMNFFVDPLDLYGFNFLPPIEFNRYEKKVQLLEALPQPPQALILGSSRAETFDPQMVEEITGLRCFNMSQPAARIETVTAALKIALLDRHDPIQLVIVEADPQYFHPGQWISPQARFAPEYVKYLDSDSTIPILKERITRLMTIEQTRSSLVSIRRAIFPGKKPPRLEYRADGMGMFPEYEEEQRNGTYDLKKVLDKRIVFYPENSLGLSTFTGLSDAGKKKWEAFLSLCTANHIRVIAYMPPVHPRLWNLLEKLKADWIYTETDQYLKQSVESVGGTYMDCTHIGSFGGNPNDFRDEVHIGPEMTVKLLEHLLADYRE
jgi:hypothetical protein